MLTTHELQGKVACREAHPGQEVPPIPDLVALAHGEHRDFLEHVLGKVVVAHDGPDVGQELDPLAKQQDNKRFLVDWMGPPADGWSPCISPEAAGSVQRIRMISPESLSHGGSGTFCRRSRLIAGQ